MKRFLYSLNLRAASVTAAIAVAVAGSALAFNTASKGKTDHPTVNVVVDESAVPRDGLPRGSFAPVVKKVSPAVVKIVTTTKLNNTETQEFPGFDDPFWKRFFGEQFNRMVPRGNMGPQIQHGLGSGVIVT